MNFTQQDSKKRCLKYRKRILGISQKVRAIHAAGAFSAIEMVDKIYFGLMRKKNNKNFSRSFSRNFVYGTRDNQFDLSQYERLVTRDLIDQIINKINIFIFLDS